MPPAGQHAKLRVLIIYLHIIELVTHYRKNFEADIHANTLEGSNIDSKYLFQLEAEIKIYKPTTNILHR